MIDMKSRSETILACLPASPFSEQVAQLHSDMLGTIDQLRARIAELEAQRVPEGCALIPLDTRYSQHKPLVTNRMKATCMGEFTVTLEVAEVTEDGEATGEVVERDVDVPWDTIKAIYKRMASEALLAAAPQPDIAAPAVSDRDGVSDAAPPVLAEVDSREACMVTLRSGDDGTPAVWCDPEIADLVDALNNGRLATVASCSGHGRRPGVISLRDGRELIVARDYAEARIVESHFPGINGELSLAGQRQARAQLGAVPDALRGEIAFNLLQKNRHIEMPTARYYVDAVCDQLAASGGRDDSPEARFNHYLQTAIDSAPEPLRRLGEYLTSVLDEDRWPAAERLLNGACVAVATGGRDDAVTLLRKITECRECGSSSLTWDTHYKTDSGVEQGRLRTSEVRCLFVLGCDECSETLSVVSAEQIAAAQPATGGRDEYVRGVKAMATEAKQLCRDFSDLRDRPYMGDVTVAIDALAEQVAAAQPVQEQPE